MMVSRLRASLEAQRGSAVFTNMLNGTDPLLAAPRQGMKEGEYFHSNHFCPMRLWNCYQYINRL